VRVLGISLTHPAVYVEKFAVNVSVDCFVIFLYRFLLWGFPKRLI
jgi:hypothetical protein